MEADQIDCSCEDIASDGNLPADVMVSILSNLPVKSLLRFKAVSKPWCSLISSPNFVKTHLCRQSVVANNLLILFDDWVDRKFGLLPHNFSKYNCADNDDLILEIPPLFSLKENFLYIVDSCNGLVCLHSLMGRFDGLILWNPGTRKYRCIELPIGDYLLSFTTLGLYYVEALNDFKIVGWTNKPYLFVYSLTSHSWEKLDYDAKYFRVALEHPTFVSGCMHWLINTCICSSSYTCSFTNMITAFDVMDGAMSCFSVPNSCGHSFEISRQTFVINGCLSIATFPEDEKMDRSIEVWVMVEYGDEGSWVKRYNIPGLTQVMAHLIPWKDNVMVFREDEEFSKILTFYDTHRKKNHYLEFESFFICQVFSYVESLASVEPEPEPER